MTILSFSCSIFWPRPQILRTVRLYTNYSLPHVSLCPFARSLATVSMESVKRVVENDAVIKSVGDDRLYRCLELSNGLKCLLVSDPTTDKASAALDVNIGSMSDPAELPGLARFLEHMLFLGTEKYPQENEYAKYLSEHAGSSNAYTGDENTNFHFEVAPEALPGALDRFAQFFLAPLFTEDATDREVNAVNSENSKNLQVDSWRMHQLNKALCREDHAYNKFGTGNKETLDTLPKGKGTNVREELLAFHAKYYSSNIMSLAVLGKNTLDELQEMILGQFVGVKNKDVTVPQWPENPLGPEQIKMLREVVPVKESRSLTVRWGVPDMLPYYRSQPGHYLGHLIGHEGPGSILSELKAKGWANSLCGGQSSGAKGFDFMVVTCQLTEEGLEHTEDIVTLIFQYLKLLRETGPQEWIHQECKELEDMQFRFKDKERPYNYTTGMADRLHHYPMEEVLSAAHVMPEYRPDVITTLLDQMTPENCVVTVVGKKFEGKTDAQEKWYGTDYKKTLISDELLKRWSAVELHPKLQLPLKNEFIPTDFSLAQPEEEENPLPRLIENSEMTRVWFKQDAKFKLPKLYANFEIRTPVAYSNPVNYVMAHLFTELFRDALTEYSYSAELAGLKYFLSSSTYGVSLSVKGYSHKVDVLLAKVMEIMRSFKVDPKRFEIYKEEYARSLRNFKTSQPINQSVYYTQLLMDECYWTIPELQEVVDEPTPETLQAFIPVLLAHVKIEALVYGNSTEQRAIDIVKIVEDQVVNGIKSKPLSQQQQRRFREFRLPDGGSFEFGETNEVHESHCAHMYLQVGSQGPKPNALLELLCQITSEPCFDVLRTKEQLGYMVFSGVRRSCGVQGLRVIVQSDRTPEYVEGRIEAFLRHLKELIEKMDDETYTNHVEALATKRLEKPKKMKEQHSRYWGEISCQQFFFDRAEKEVAELRKLTKDDILKFYEEVISHESPRRHKLCVHVRSSVGSGEASNTTTPEDLLPVPDNVAKSCTVSSVCDFKRDLGLYPLARPFINIPPPQPAKAKL